jgi:hypothetical protein
MNNAAAIIRSLIIYGLCLPMAVYLGYVLAIPWGRGDFAFIFLILCLPLIPVLMKWHHLLLVASWNMSMVLFFVQGAPYLWMAMTAISLLLTVLQFILKRDVHFATVPTVALPLLFLGLVIVLTAQLTGGIGLAAFSGGGGGMIGGKRYIQLFCAIAGYFAISSHRIEPDQAGKYVMVYFLGFLTMIFGSIAQWMPRGMYWIYSMFPVETLAFASGPGAGVGESRLSGVGLAACGVFYFILATYGLKGVLQSGERWRFLPFQFRGSFGINAPWRMLLLVVICGISLMGGYRSVPITLGLVFAFHFFREGLHRTVWAPLLLSVGLLAFVVSIPFMDQLPFTIQRSLSFLPLNVSEEVKQNAETSSDWRVEMWKEVVPTVPQYLLIGKGYAIDSREQEMSMSIAENRSDAQDDVAILAQDYHNGPLSLIIPLGIFGVLGFLWFLGAAWHVLLENSRHGDPAHQQINTFLLGFFLVKVLFFFAIYGSFQNDLVIFTGIVGLSCALNGGIRRPATAPAKPNPAYLPFRLPKPLRAENA